MSVIGSCSIPGHDYSINPIALAAERMPGRAVQMDDLPEALLMGPIRDEDPGNGRGVEGPGQPAGFSSSFGGIRAMVACSSWYAYARSSASVQVSPNNASTNGVPSS